MKIRIDNFNPIQHYVDVVLTMTGKEYKAICSMAELDGFSPEYYMHNKLNIVAIEVDRKETGDGSE